MEIKVSSPKQALSPSDYSDPEEKEVSEDDDDDRNHKHRRREARSQSLERDSLEPILTKSFRKRNTQFDNGHPYKDGNSQSAHSWKNYNTASMESDLYTRSEKRRPGMASFSRTPSEPNQKIRMNQPQYIDSGPGKGRGWDAGSWAHRDSRFGPIDIASQLVQRNPMPPNVFAGRGIQTVANAQTVPWSGFGLVPGVNGSIDTLHSLGLQGTLIQPMDPTMNIGIPRQRCRDFEERGFCLRGDMCPMEHGVNRIVVEDVQSLSQFNLPVSLPNANLTGAPAAQGPLPVLNAPNTLSNSKVGHSKSCKPGMTDEGSSVAAIGADLYDPDQPLWSNNRPETSAALLALDPPGVDDTKPLLNMDASGHGPVGVSDGIGNERSTKGAATGFQAPSIWGRINSSKGRLPLKDKPDSTVSSNSLDYETQESFNTAHGIPRLGKRVKVDKAGLQSEEASLKPFSDSGRNARKPSQKALRTLFVNGIPQKDNKREALFLHFRKFGEVIDIYIPSNSERAFVQFSKREEAEAALKAPDAVMGNRFIKLWWANRDSVPDDSLSSGNNGSVATNGQMLSSGLPHATVVNKGRDNLPPVFAKATTVPSSVVPEPASDQSKLIVGNGLKAPPPSQKKLENLELLKEELRKKQEMLDRKRNEFRRQLDKLEKQGDPTSKRHKGVPVGDPAKATASRSSDQDTVQSPRAELMVKNLSVENASSHSSRPGSVAALPESSTSKHSIRPLAPAGPSFLINRFKLDNRPTSFKILPPLPSGFANVSIMKEHFSAYGDMSTVELEGSEAQDSENHPDLMRISARVSFTTRRSAERAFLQGKCWQGHNMHFVWQPSGNQSKENDSKCPSDFSTGESASIGSLKAAPSEVDFSTGESASIGSLKAAPSEVGELETMERKESHVDCAGAEKDVISSSTSCEKQSP